MLLAALTDQIPPGPIPKIKAKLIARLFPTIEAAIAGGYSHAEVHNALVAAGLTIELNYYHDVIYRLRKKRMSCTGPVVASEPGPSARIATEGRAQDDVTTRTSSVFKDSAKTAVFSEGLTPSGERSTVTIPNKNQRDERFNPRNARNFDVNNI